MTDAILIAAIEPSAQVALIGLASLIVTTIGTLIAAWIALQHAKLSKAVKVVEEKVQTVEKNTNSMKDALVASTAKASHAEGIIQEKAAETIRKAEIVIAIGQQSESPTIQQPKPVAAATLVSAIDAVPEKTATKVVEKLAEK